MSRLFLRVYKEMDIKEIGAHLLIYGDLSGSCASCQKMGVELNADKCPECMSEFKYVTFRNIKENMPKMKRLSEARPNVTFIDFDDYKRLSGAAKAKELFG